ncbi:MAG: SDR family oxidoreductase [Chitinophagaceae bacterium]|nr:MAG: SDR family oxidoreductase [Chitinophagaceae bacterium]
MTQKYVNKVVVVTGSSRGVGRHIVEHFLANGAQVIGISRGGSEVAHDAYTHFSADIGLPDQVTKTFRQIQKTFKQVDIVINNAAVLTSQYSLILPAKNVMDMVNVNLLGTFFVSREAAKLMRKNEYGRIINIGSMAASLEPVGDSIYAACKAGINTIANVMAKEFAAMQITCNTLAITAIETDMLNQLPRHKIDEIINKLPVPRYAKPEDIFNVIDFFAAEQSSYITAQVIYLGGVN